MTIVEVQKYIDVVDVYILGAGGIGVLTDELGEGEVWAPRNAPGRLF
jgi:hypothetical protein